jgi:CubicO group peptidase (beta-lactamase class C family)
MYRFAASALLLILCSAEIPCVQATAPADIAEQTHACANAQEQTRECDAALDSFVTGFFEAALTDQGVPGAAVTVIADRRTVLARAFGYADLQQHRVVTVDRSIFQLGSVSKLFTWIAVMQQVEAGRLDLDRDVNDYLDFRIPERFGKRITLRHLMTHTAGFDESARDQISSSPPAPLEQLVPSHLPPAIYPPGAVISYSNYGAELAGYVVQRISGMPFRSYVQQHILAPLGMNQSTFDEPPPPALAQLAARGYLPGRREPKTEYGSGPAGGFSATTADMGRFVKALLNDGCLDEVCILKPGTLAQMFKRQRPLAPNLTNGMGLGFWIRDRNNVQIRGQSGRLVGFQADLVLLPERHIGYFMVSNGEGINHAALRAQDDFFVNFIDRFVAPEPPIDAAPLNLSTAREAAGVYEPTRWFHTGVLSLASLLRQTIVSAPGDGSLTVSSFVRADGSPRRWLPIGRDLFADEDRGTKLELLRDPTGKVSGFATDLLPVLQFERSSGWLSMGSPAAMLALLVLLVAAVSLPWGWVVRRRYGVALSGKSRFNLLFKLARVGAWFPVVALASWCLIVIAFLSDYTLISARANALLTTMRVLTGVSALAAGLLLLDGIMAWWDRDRGVARRLWAGVIAGAAAIFLILVSSFGLVNFSLMY